MVETKERCGIHLSECGEFREPMMVGEIRQLELGPGAESEIHRIFV